MDEKWVVINKKADFAAIAQRYRIDPVTARILRNRDLTEDEEIRLFLQGTLEDLYDPHLLLDADRLSDILLEKIRDKLPIRIIGDYDIDGVNATYIFMKALMRLGANVSVKIPERIADGYGLNVHLIDQAYAEGVDTILTCDNGISALEEIKHAKELGMTLLVTDHHEVPFEERDGVRVEKQSLADAVVNPHRMECQYPNKALCGAAVAWKVVCILYEKRGFSLIEAYEFLENVAFATVGDIMSLTGENRILVKEGLRRIHCTDNVGLSALIAQCGLEKSEIAAYHFGYVLGPCINASGRLDTARRALELLSENNQEKAVMYASELVTLNQERKAMTGDGVELAKEQCETAEYKDMPVLVVYLPDVHESIAGIIAGRIREYYNKPTFVLTRGAEGVKGSGRSIETYSMYEELCKCEDLFTRFGGHPMAAGLSLPEENVDEFRRRINACCTLTKEDLVPKIRIDVPMPMDYVSMELVRELEMLEPFGKDNERPVFADKGIAISRMWVLGKNRNVLKLSLRTSSHTRIDGIFFGDIDAFCSFLTEKFGESAVDAAWRGLENNITISAVYRPSIHRFRGEESLQFEIRNYC